MDKNRLGGYIGATIGSMGWMIGFTVVCLVSGPGGSVAGKAAGQRETRKSDDFLNAPTRL